MKTWVIYTCCNRVLGVIFHKLANSLANARSDNSRLFKTTPKTRLRSAYSKISKSSIAISILTCLFSPSSIFAGIYQCIDNDGLVEFRETPCYRSKEQVFIPMAYQKTNLKMIKSQEKDLLNLEEKQGIADKQSVKMAHKIKKNQEKLAAKALRKKNNILKINQKMERLESKLKTGCKQKRIHSIKTKLEEYEWMKQHYNAAPNE